MTPVLHLPGRGTRTFRPETVEIRWKARAMSIWYRVMCDRHQPPTPVCDIEHDRATGRISLYPQTVVRVPELVDTTDLDTRVQVRADAIRIGETPTKYSDGLITTSHADMIRREGFWITCLLCKLGERKKKLSARVQSDEMLGWVLDRMTPLQRSTMWRYGSRLTAPNGRRIQRSPDGVLAASPCGCFRSMTSRRR